MSHDCVRIRAPTGINCNKCPSNLGRTERPWRAQGLARLSLTNTTHRHQRQSPAPSPAWRLGRGWARLGMQVRPETLLPPEDMRRTRGCAVRDKASLRRPPVCQQREASRKPSEHPSSLLCSSKSELETSFSATRALLLAMCRRQMGFVRRHRQFADMHENGIIRTMARLSASPPRPRIQHANQVKSLVDKSRGARLDKGAHRTHLMSFDCPTRR